MWKRYIIFKIVKSVCRPMILQNLIDGNHLPKHSKNWIFCTPGINGGGGETISKVNGNMFVVVTKQKPMEQKLKIKRVRDFNTLFD